MPHYRLFCIDPEGRFFRCEEIEAADDDEAARLSIALRGAHAAELWTGARLVTSFGAGAASPSPHGAAAPARPDARAQASA